MLNSARMNLNLGGEWVFPLAQALSSHGEPFLRLSYDGVKARPHDRPDGPF